MANERTLLEARKRANIVRYTGDKHDSHIDYQPERLADIVAEFSRSALEVNVYVTPDLDKCVAIACFRLGVPREAVNVFVYSSHEIQAACYYTSTEQCLIRLSSSLVNLLSPEEICFVIGHELGHFLLQHSPVATSTNSFEYFVFQRAKEISADRIGYFATSDGTSSLRAFMKTASGLLDHHLGDLSERYIEQLKNLKNSKLRENPFNTHPPLLVRAYILDKFISHVEDLDFQCIENSQVVEANNETDAIVSQFLDQDYNEKLAELDENFRIWSAAKIVCSDGRFDRSEQEKFKELFGDETLNKLIAFIGGLGNHDVMESISKKIKLAEDALLNFSPERSSHLKSEALADLAKAFQ